MNTDDEIAKLKQRNTKVELDKKWETSWTRRIFVGIVTYLIVVLYSHLIGAQNAWLTSLVPVMGFLLSTVSLNLIRKIWEKRIK